MPSKSTRAVHALPTRRPQVSRADHAPTVAVTSSLRARDVIRMTSALIRVTYTTADLASQYQLMTSLCRQRQEPGQSISAFLPQIYSIWDQLTPFEPKWLCAGDSTLFATYRDQQRLILFLMGLSDIYEPVRASLLHRIPFLTLEQAISELLSEETRLGLVSTSHVATALATPGSRGRGSSGGSRSFSASSSPSSGGLASRPNECTFCHATDHRLLICPIRVCKNCHRRGSGHYRSDCPNNPTCRDSRPQSTAATARVSSTASVSSTLINISDIPVLVQQIMSASGNPSTALSASTGISSWFFDSGCSNHHMTSDLSVFSSKSYDSSFPVVHTADGSSTTIDHVGLVSTSALSLPNTYYDPRTGQTLGIGRSMMSSSSTPPYLTDPSIDLFPDDVNVPANSPDDTLHMAPLPIVYPVESSSTDPAPPVLPPAPLPSDIPARRSTRTADIFTKSLLPGRFDALVTKLNCSSMGNWGGIGNGGGASEPTLPTPWRSGLRWSAPPSVEVIYHRLAVSEVVEQPSKVKISSSTMLNGLVRSKPKLPEFYIEEQIDIKGVSTSESCAKGELHGESATSVVARTVYWDGLSNKEGLKKGKKEKNAKKQP
ncbi:hypothetical protein Acr_22g0003040 [Actinidia rufa]|uniref:Uncharacterized protein n=1 Tax=Actinidia rufa TaxID=165716 RepID=A0A7J0GJB9_9ERIC|nr:hypothetical protein Acr_22g0003040 [Actinidia rufa]